MTLSQLKTVLRAACKLSGESEFYVIGSAAILNVFQAPEHLHLSRSIEADLIALSGDPDVADLLSVNLGELSPFHDLHDVYADGVTFDAPKYAPAGWQVRAVPVHYEDIAVTARFMEIHDLTLSKLGAGRPKDMEFCRPLAATGYLDASVLAERLPEIECTETQRNMIAARTSAILAS